MIAKIITLVHGILLVSGAAVINEGYNEEVESPGLPLFYFEGNAYYFQTFSTELWIRVGAAATKRFLPLRTLAKKIGYSLCSVLLALHHLTGADYTSKVGTKHGALQASPDIHLTTFALGVSDPEVNAAAAKAEQYLVQVIKKNNVSANQEEGSLFCKNLDMGLVNIESKRENDFLFDTIGTLVDYETSSFWTSGLRHGKIWYWSSTGKPFSYTNWQSNEPTNETSGSCLEVVQNSAEITMLWSDSDCTATNYIICESESESTTTSSP